VTAVQLTLTDIALAAVLMLANALASVLLRWQMHRQFLWASVRMVVQLLLVGFVLRLVFKAASPAASLIVAALMIAAAGREVAVRPAWGLKGLRKYYLSSAVVSVASSVTVVLALMTAIRPSPWYDPRYAIPLLGIVLGSVLNSATIALDSSSTVWSTAAPQWRRSWLWATPSTRR
jgi:putative ABC transport system permease protein